MKLKKMHFLSINSVFAACCFYWSYHLCTYIIYLHYFVKGTMHNYCHFKILQFVCTRLKLYLRCVLIFFVILFNGVHFFSFVSLYGTENYFDCKVYVWMLWDFVLYEFTFIICIYSEIFLICPPPSLIRNSPLFVCNTTHSRSFLNSFFFNFFFLNDFSQIGKRFLYDPLARTCPD